MPDDTTQRHLLSQVRLASQRLLEVRRRNENREDDVVPDSESVESDCSSESLASEEEESRLEEMIPEETNPEEMSPEEMIPDENMQQRVQDGNGIVDCQGGPASPAPQGEVSGDDFSSEDFSSEDDFRDEDSFPSDSDDYDFGNLTLGSGNGDDVGGDEDGGDDEGGDDDGGDSDDPVGLETANLQEWEKEIIRVKAVHNISYAALNDLITLMNRTDLIDAAKYEGGGKLPCLKTVLRREAQRRPPILMDGQWMDVNAGAIISRTECVVYPKNFFGKGRYLEQYTITYQKLEEIIAFHNDRHSQPATEYVLGIDDVPESRSTSISQSVICIKFQECDEVYLWSLLRCPVKKSLSTEDWLEPIVDALNRSGLTLKCIVADKMMRSSIGGVKAPAGYYACERCHVKGKHHKHMYFPGFGKEKRTDSGFRAIANNLGDYLTKDLKKGIGFRSPLLDLNGYNAVSSMPQEYMHLYGLGHLRRMYKLTFEHGCKYKGNLAMTDRIPVLEELIKEAKVPKQFSRRTKDLSDCKLLKASQWIHLGVHLFPVLLVTLPNPAPVTDVWALTCFLLKGYLLPNEKYDAWKGKYDLEALHKELHYAYVDVFGASNSTYTLHALEHGPDAREEHSFFESSAFPFEGSYGHMLRSMTRGTMHLCKQALSGSMRRKVEGHRCKRTLWFSTHETAMSDDTLVFNKDMQLFKIHGVEGSGSNVRLKVKEIPLRAFKITLSSRTPLNFSDVGSFKYETASMGEGRVKDWTYDDVAGKGVAVRDTVSFCCPELLREMN